MRILKQIIEKKLELHNEFILNRQYLRSIWQFYACYNLALAILGVNPNDLEIRKRNRIWRKWLLKEGVFDEKKFKKIQRYIQEDMKVIIQALNLIGKINDENEYDMGTIYREDRSFVGVLSYEFPE